MPRARRRKDSTFQKSMTKSVFLYGNPNVGKLSALKRIQRLYTILVNEDIKLLADNRSVFLQVVKNDKKDSAIRAFEKSVRRKGINSAFCQSAFDTAVTCLSNRLQNIRLDMISDGLDVFASSKVLFAMSVLGRSRTDMIQCMKDIGKDFHIECAKKLTEMTDKKFQEMQRQFEDSYVSRSLEYKIPVFKRISVPLDSRLMRLEKSTDTVMPYVIAITDPEHKSQRITVPIDTSTHSLHKIKCNKMAGSVMMQVRGGNLRITWSYSVKRKQPKTSVCVGVDTGIVDAFHTSNGEAIGSMAEVIDFYHKEVEPAFAYLSDLRNKKRKIRYYLRHHKLPEDVKCSLIRKMDMLEQMIREAEAPYRKKRAYYNQLDHAIHSAVTAYIKGITPDTLTVIEKLDIKKFDKSRKSNGMFSMFARGKLQEKLMETLNWKGFDFIEVAPDYTSQVCPVCSNLDPANRDQKVFQCTCCHYEDDADHVGALNIRTRAEDEEILKICNEHKYHHTQMQKALRELYKKRADEYKTQHPCRKACIPQTSEL